MNNPQMNPPMMDHHQTLQAHLASQGADSDCAAVIEALADAARELARQIAIAPLSGVDEGDATVNSDGDVQKALDLVADNLMRDALRRAPVAGILSEEVDRPETVNAAAPLCVAIDPLDGSSNLQNNISVGTIFSIRPRGRDVLSSFFEPGTAQRAAGFFVYGPQTCLVLAIDHRVDLYVLHPVLHEFMLAKTGIRIAQDTPEFAINASNRRHWSGTVRNYVDECLSGAAGPRGRDFNMRWIASLVAEAYRILMRGGVFLYPADARPGYREGRLRLVYEAHPMALIMEWAGGSASSGRARILELSARSPHQRAPLIMGDVRLVRDVDQLHEGVEPLFETSDAPLFARRGLFR